MDEACSDSAGSLQPTQAEGEQQQPAQSPVFCQVLGCGVLLTGGKTYCIKKRTCAVHIQAESVLLSGDGDAAQQCRFCQQCGKFEPLNKFDGTKRSCRARLAKRRSGTRALLQKKGGKSDHHSADQDRADISTMQDATGFSAEQQLMMMYGNSNEQLLGLLAPEGSCAAAAAAVAAPSRSNPYSGTSATPSLSDGTPMAAAAAAATAAAANSAAYAAAHHSLSAPLYMFAGGASPMDPRMQLSAAVQARACREDQMDQQELLMALQAMTDSSEPLPRMNSTATAGAVVGGGESSPTAGADNTSCSLPLMQLKLDHVPNLTPVPGSPANSMGGAPCRSAPLATLKPAGGSLGSFQGLIGTQRSLTTSAAAAALQQQQSGLPKSASRLKWLIQELQQELDTCGPSELDALNNDELGTLLCAALAPARGEAAPGSAGAALASAQAAAAPMSDIYMQDAAAPASYMKAGQASMAMGTHNFQSFGGMSGQMQQPDISLQMQKAQVSQLQQQVQQLQAQLQMTKESGVSGKQMCPAPLPAPARTVSAGAGFTGARGSAEMLPVYHQASAPNISQEGGTPGLLQQRTALGGVLGSSNARPQPVLSSGMQMQAAAATAGVANAGVGSRPCTPANAPTVSMTNTPVWGAGAESGMPSANAMQMEQMLRQQQMQLQQLQQLHQQQMQQQAAAGMQMPLPMSGDSSAVMQFMSLQSQLKMVEDEMMMLVAQQANCTR